MALPDERSRFESLTIDDEGFVILKWPRAVTITGPSARHAMDEVNRSSRFFSRMNERSVIRVRMRSATTLASRPVVSGRRTANSSPP